MSTARRQAWWATAALGAGVIAVCYGFARYAYGLFVPKFGAVFHLAGTGLGVLAGLSTLGYTVGLLVAPWAAARSARATTVGAGALAAAGLLTMSVAGSVTVFGVGLAVGGGGAGLISPGVAQLISDTVRPAVRVQAQTWANTGTSLGLAASAFTPMLAFGWRRTWLLFGAAAAAIALVALLALPRRGPAAEPARAPLGGGGSLWRPGLTSLLVNSILLGLTSAPYWNFSRQRVLQAGLSVPLSTWVLVHHRRRRPDRRNRRAAHQPPRASPHQRRYLDVVGDRHGRARAART